MPRSEIQTLQIANLVSEWDTCIGVTTKGMQFGIERLKRLQDQDFDIEALLVHAQMVEHGLKMLLEGYATKRRILKVLGEADPFLDCKLHYADDETLGRLITILRCFIGKTDFVEHLGKMNGIRNEAVHSLFSGRKDVEELNKRAADFIGTGLPPILLGLKAAVNKVHQEIQEIVAKSAPSSS